MDVVGNLCDATWLHCGAATTDGHFEPEKQIATRHLTERNIYKIVSSIHYQRKIEIYAFK